MPRQQAYVLYEGRRVRVSETSENSLARGREGLVVGNNHNRTGADFVTLSMVEHESDATGEGRVVHRVVRADECLAVE